MLRPKNALSTLRILMYVYITIFFCFSLPLTFILFQYKYIFSMKLLKIFVNLLTLSFDRPSFKLWNTNSMSVLLIMDLFILDFYFSLWCIVMQILGMLYTLYIGYKSYYIFYWDVGTRILYIHFSSEGGGTQNRY